MGDVALSRQLFDQVIGALWCPTGLNSQDMKNLLESALAALKGIKPVDEIEGMLAVQMISTHNAALECLRRAMRPEQLTASRDQNLKQASRLMALYTQQMDSLSKHRGKGQQKVTVEYLHVEAGGPSVDGNIGTIKDQARGAGRRKSPSARLAYSPSETIDVLAKPRTTVKHPRKDEKQHERDE